MIDPPMNAPSQRIVRVALTETCNAYRLMPATIDGLGAPADRLGEVRAANIAHNMDLVDRAADHGAQIVGLGELCSAPYFALVRDRMWLALAEDAAAGPTVSACRERARARGVCVVAPIFEDDPVSGRRFNTAVVIDERGEILGKYRKTHIPEGQNELGSFHETFYYGPSDGELGEMPGNVAQNPFFPVFETRFGRLGVAICYDRHFEGVMRSLVAGGAELIFSPAITFGDKSEHFWEREFEVDAMRHRVFIVGSNRLGVEPPFGVHYFGRSHVAGPDGRVSSQRDLPNMIIIIPESPRDRVLCRRD